MTEWISVKFALPVDCRQILVTNGAFIGFTYFDVHDRKFEPTDGKYIDIFDPKCDYQIECLPESITHWAQLPEPPDQISSMMQDIRKDMADSLLPGFKRQYGIKDD